jgi:hypothetical protein
MQLPRGITGFRHHRDAELPQCNLSDFKSHCYAASRAVGGRVILFRTPEEMRCRSYAMCLVEVGRYVPGSVGVLLNSHFPWMGLANSPRLSDVEFEYTDCQELAAALAGLGEYRILSAAELQQSLDEAAISQLADCERDQIQVFKPRCIGEVVFSIIGISGAIVATVAVESHEGMELLVRPTNAAEQLQRCRRHAYNQGILPRRAFIGLQSHVPTRLVGSLVRSADGWSSRCSRRSSG